MIPVPERLRWSKAREVRAAVFLLCMRTRKPLARTANRSRFPAPSRFGSTRSSKVVDAFLASEDHESSLKP